jgi:hypothetical protein
MSSGPPPKDRTAEREAKLAQALRANLRRRKTPPKSAESPPPRPDGDST